ncbi:hypothetical protein KUTeg_023617 [Tegillarca granosa]|uniref:Mediator of RNA polymerase II transcription subunit 25 n=1 Tax=Tegillarca granosa TaxID=220873 RepID=A0ABQ9E2Q1_TEGGR|nr:hypothetical protein KUTeg_023617 [Tegillarca granosa]
MVLSESIQNPSDVVFVVEATANLGAYIDVLKEAYILPSLEVFNGGPPDPTDYGHDYSCTLYNLVTFFAADIVPDNTSRCSKLTTSTHEFITWLENVPFIGGGSETCSHIAEGLSTALHVFDDLQAERKNVGMTGEVRKYCILVCNSPPYQLPSAEGPRYVGYTSEQLASMMAQRGISLTIISPRKIPALQRLYEESNTGEMNIGSLKDFTTDPRHHILLRGYQLEERSHSPNNEPDVISAMDQNTSIQSGPVHSPLNTVRGLSPAPMDPGPFKVPSTSAIPPVNTQQPSPIASQQQQPMQQTQQHQLQHQQQQQHQMQQPPNQFQQQQPQDQLHQHIQNTTSATNQMIRQGISPRDFPTPSTQQSDLQGRPPNAGPRMPQMMQNRQQPNMMQSQMDMMQSQNPIISSQENVMTSQQNPSLSHVQQPQPVSSTLQMTQQMTPQMTQQNQPGPSGFPGPSGLVPDDNLMGIPQTNAPMSQNNQIKDRKIIWSGLLEWQEKVKPGVQNTPKVPRSLHCHLSIGQQDPDINTTSWPKDLIMQLIPQSLLNSPQLQPLFKSSRQVAFHFGNHNLDALKNLYKVMGTGFAGCVHFPTGSQCDVRVLLLLFSNKRKAFIGLIPNDQTAFVNGIRTVIYNHKIKQQTKFMQQPQMGQFGGAQPGMGVTPGMPTPPQMQPNPSNTMPATMANPVVMTTQPGNMMNNQQQGQQIRQPQMMMARGTGPLPQGQQGVMGGAQQVLQPNMPQISQPGPGSGPGPGQNIFDDLDLGSFM